MIRRTVQFTAMADGGVTPAIPVFGGVKGEHNATELAVTLDDSLYEQGDFVRLSFTTGDGTVLSSDLIEDITVTDGMASFRYPLPQLLTVAAGQLCARVVLSRLDEHGKELTVWRSGEMVLYFEHADVENGTPFWTGVSEMLSRTVSAKKAAERAEMAANVCASDAQGYADDAKMHTEGARDAVEAAKAAKDAAVEAQSAVERAKSDINGVKEFVSNCTDNAIKAQNAARQAATDAENAAASAWEAVGTPGPQGPQGEKGDTGTQGAQGPKGDPYTLTDTDKAAIVSDVLTALGGVPVFGYVDDDNTIVVSGNLASGEYAVKYETEDGTVMDIGTLTLSADEPVIPDEPDEPEDPDTPVVSIVNQIPISTDASGNLFVGENGEVGYKPGYRLSMSAGTEKALDGYAVTGFIPAKAGDVLRIKHIAIAEDNNINIACYDANKQPINGGTSTYGTTLYNLFVTRGTEENGVYIGTLNSSAHLAMQGDLAYIRIGSTSITDDSVLTVNQAIV